MEGDKGQTYLKFPNSRRSYAVGILGKMASTQVLTSRQFLDEENDPKYQPCNSSSNLKFCLSFHPKPPEETDACAKCNPPPSCRGCARVTAIGRWRRTGCSACAASGIGRAPRARRIDYYVIHLADAVNVMALTADEQVILVRQFRAGSGHDSLETPGGLLDPGEDPLAAGAASCSKRPDTSATRPSGWEPSGRTRRS